MKNAAPIFPWQVYGGIACLLLLAAAPLPYGYYTFMRIIVCGCAGLLCHRLFAAGDKEIWPWLWGMVAILFNPFIIIHMTKEVWMIVDIAAGLLFGYIAFLGFKTTKKPGPR